MKPYSIARGSQEPFSVNLIGVSFVLVAYGVFFLFVFFYLVCLLAEFLIILCAERKRLLIGLMIVGGSVLCKLWPISEVPKRLMFLSALVGSLLRCKAQT